MSDAPKQRKTTALDAAKADHIDKIKTFKYADEVFVISRKPNALLLSELSGTEADGGAEALALLSEFFETVLGATEYRRFRRVFADSLDSDDEGFDKLGEVLREAIEACFGRPTQ